MQFTVFSLVWPELGVCMCVYISVCCAGQSLRTLDQGGLLAVSWRSLCPIQTPQALLEEATAAHWSHLIKSRGWESETRRLEVTRTRHKIGHMDTSHQTSQKAMVNNPECVVVCLISSKQCLSFCPKDEPHMLWAQRRLGVGSLIKHHPDCFISERDEGVYYRLGLEHWLWADRLLPFFGTGKGESNQTLSSICSLENFLGAHVEQICAGVLGLVRRL